MRWLKYRPFDYYNTNSQFAVQTIRQWCLKMGYLAYPQATELLITADGDGSNGSRRSNWKLELQLFADETGLKMSVFHFPPGTSFCPKIEYCMFSHITQNWRALISHEVIVNLIANTRIHTGLKIQAALD
jgi:hypothetical protein